MTEAIERAVEVWNAMQRDPAMLSGLTMGEVEDLATGVASLVGEVATVRRSIPVVLTLQMDKLADGTVDQVIAFMREMLNLEPLRAELDRRAAL